MMIFNLYVQQHRWIVLALLAGAVLVLLFALTYMAMWRPREEESERESKIIIKGPVSFMKWLLTIMPWPLVLVVVGTFVYGAIHTAMAMIELPNW
jgi:hypothetical protein